MRIICSAFMLQGLLALILVSVVGMIAFIERIDHDNPSGEDRG